MSKVDELLCEAINVRSEMIENGLHADPVLFMLKQQEFIARAIVEAIRELKHELIADRSYAAELAWRREEDRKTMKSSGLSFGEAMMVVATGGTVTRKSHSATKYACVRLPLNDDFAHCSDKDGRTTIPFVPGKSDILSTDWEVVE